MRITNRIITNNSLTNINRVKVKQDELNTQMSTGKKITKPSDDPVVAIRALRLRTGASQVDQYFEKNAEDAEAWLNVTSSTLSTVSDILEDMVERVGKGSSDDMATSERQVLASYLKSLAQEIYDNGDADYAGRHIFTGYRTDVSLTFPEDTELKYSITEQLDKENISTVNRVYTDDLLDFTKENYAALNSTEQSIDDYDVYRIQLAYHDVDTATAPQVSYTDPATGATVNVTVNITSLNSATDPYVNVADGEANFIPETGELILGKDVYQAMMATKDDPTTPNVDESEIRITYEKSDWSKGDLRPEHYFNCTSTDADGKSIEYNEEFLNGGGRQIIEFATGNNQAIQINTLADECFTHDIGNMVGELDREVERLASIESIVDKLDKIVGEGGLSGSDLTTAEDRLEAAKKAQVLQRDKVQKMFDHAKTLVQGFIKQTNLASTNCGSRGSRLELIQNRLSDQQLTMDNLVSENEDCDETEVAIELAGAQLAYEASLMATSKITKTTLLDYI